MTIYQKFIEMAENFRRLSFNAKSAGNEELSGNFLYYANLLETKAENLPVMVAGSILS